MTTTATPMSASLFCANVRATSAQGLPLEATSPPSGAARTSTSCAVASVVGAPSAAAPLSCVLST